MKNTPIVILNKDRLGPLKMLVDSLQIRGYNNIIIIDNESTYEPLLEWYKTTSAEVFINTYPETKYDNSTLYRLVEVVQHPKFVDMVKEHYVYTDSDVIPLEEAPENFIDDMIMVCKKYNLHKVGLGLKIDDLPTNPGAVHHKTNVLGIEGPYWTNRLPDPDFELYKAPIDTTFAVYAPNSPALWGDNCFRMGGAYTARHLPWYYDLDNLPEDELHYIKYLQGGRGPVFSMMVKQMKELQ